MTIKNLIEKMGDSRMYDTQAVIEIWMTEKYDDKNEKYNKIYGFIWGLYSTGFITKNERGSLIADLREKTYKE